MSNRSIGLEVIPTLPSEALSCRDVAHLYPSLTTESAARRLLLARVRAGETGFVVEGGPIKVRGCWLATLGWWWEVLHVA